MAALGWEKEKNRGGRQTVSMTEEGRGLQWLTFSSLLTSLSLLCLPFYLSPSLASNSRRRAREARPLLLRCASCLPFLPAAVARSDTPLEPIVFSLSLCLSPSPSLSFAVSWLGAHSPRATNLHPEIRTALRAASALSPLLSPLLSSVTHSSLLHTLPLPLSSPPFLYSTYT